MEYTNAIVYTNDETQIVFLKDADIVNDMSANTISGNSVLSNGIPSYDLFRKHYNLVSTDISAISDDVEYLKDVEKKAVVYHTTLLSTDTTTNNRLTSFLQDNFHDVNYMFKQSWMYRLSVALTLQDDNLVEKYIGENDYILFNKNKKLSEVLFEDLDVIRDSYTEVLSLKIYCDNNLCNAISSLSTALSTDINNLSTSLSDVTRLSVENLHKQVISNDSDIANLCTEISANDIDIADLQEKQLSIDTRYISTFTTKDKVANPHISSDNLVLTDPDGHIGAGTEHKQYYVSFESGTLVLKPLNF